MNESLIFHSFLCVKSHLWVIQSTHKKEFWFYLSLIKSYSSNKTKSVKIIVINSVASFDATQKIRSFLACWHQELFNGIWYHWFLNDNFQSLLYLNNPYMSKCDHMVQQKSFGSTEINFTVYFWVLIVSDCHCLRWYLTWQAKFRTACPKL